MSRLPMHPSPEATASLKSVTGLLADTARRIRDMERMAMEALHQDDDTPMYRRLMAEKAALLVELPESLEPIVDGLEPVLRELVVDKTRDMARRAGQSLQLNSVFYQAQLLYPDDYKDGDPNELELLVRFLDQRPRSHA